MSKPTWVWTVSEDSSVPRFVELMVTLPGMWHLDQDSFKDEAWYWPIRLRKELARFPHKYSTWLGFAHTVPNGDPAEPYAPGTKFCGAIILPSVTVPDGFHRLRIDDDDQVSDIIDLDRRNVARKRFGIF
jgi:hypothetical protein